MTSLLIVAHLDSPCVGVVDNPFILDGPVAWAAAVHARATGVELPPITREHAPDFELPFEQWEQSGTWGWRVSEAQYEVQSYTAIQVRRKPATGEMSRFASDKKYHSGLGPYKARDVTKQATWIGPLSWQAEVTDRARLELLLGRITHLGGHTNIGYGHVARWEVLDGSPGGWVDRPMPDTHPHLAVRAPYWHHSRRADGFRASPTRAA